MGKLKKLKGGMDLYVTEDEKLLVNSNSRNGVYVYDTDTMKQVFQTKTVSYVAQKAISPDKKLLAAKNTSGQMALISMKTGEEICRCDMAKSEGYKFTFTPDSKAVLDFDWDGRTMLLNAKGAFKILDGPQPAKKMIRCIFTMTDFPGRYISWLGKMAVRRGVLPMPMQQRSQRNRSTGRYISSWI